MTLFRTFSAAVLALYVGHAGLAVAHANAQAATSARAAQPRWRSPFVKAVALPPGPLADVNEAPHVTAAQYNDLRNAAQELLTRFPADKHYFVGLGRDPAPLVAFMQNLGGKQLAVNFPASSNQASDPGAAVLAQYVNKIIPPEVLASGRTIVFLDVTSTGRALDYYVWRLTPHLNGAPVIRAAFTTSDSQLARSPGHNVVIHTTPFPEIAQFTEPTGIYEGYVPEFPRHVPSANGLSVLDSPLAGYQVYRNAVLQRMQADETLHAFLSHRAGPAFVGESAAEKRTQQQAETAAKAATQAKITRRTGR